MIELPERPVDGVVTGFALFSERLLVGVFAVAFIASLWCAPEMRVSVTALATHAGVLSQQREHRQVVIEPQIFKPASLVVALIATFTQGTLVRVLPLMTTVAGLVLDGGLYIISVTLFTGCLLMGTLEQESCLRVIKTACAP